MINKQNEISVKVGDKVTYPSGKGVIIIDEPDKDDVVIVKDVQGEYRRVSVFNIKKIPTEEENLISEFIGDYRYIAYPSDYTCEARDKFIARAMINKGYRKIAPVSKVKLRDVMYFEQREMIIDYLIENNHIIVKD